MREEIAGKVRASLRDSGLDAVLVFGYDNVQYLTGAYLHYPPSFPDRHMTVLWANGGDPVCVLPHEWESSYLNLAWFKETRTYDEKPGSPISVAEAAANLVKDTIGEKGRIGVDAERVSVSLYEQLEAALDGYELKPCDDWLRELRMVKTPGELRLLEEVAARTDHAIAGQAHHVLVKQAATEMSNTENVRVHALERRLDEVGHHAVAQVTTGANASKFWPGAPMYGIGFDRVPGHREWMRMELTATVNGYWCSGARMLTMGEPTEEQAAAYQALVALREAALKAMKPGARCSDIYEAMRQAASDKGTQLVGKMALGAGLGATCHEAPYISGSDHTELRPGMVVNLNPVVRAPSGELLMGRDTVVVTEDGARVVGWYKDWREPFTANYTY